MRDDECYANGSLVELVSTAASGPVLSVTESRSDQRRKHPAASRVLSYARCGLGRLLRRASRMKLKRHRCTMLARAAECVGAEEGRRTKDAFERSHEPAVFLAAGVHTEALQHLRGGSKSGRLDSSAGPPRSPGRWDQPVLPEGHAKLGMTRDLKDELPPASRREAGALAAVPQVVHTERTVVSCSTSPGCAGRVLPNKFSPLCALQFERNPAVRLVIVEHTAFMEANRVDVSRGAESSSRLQSRVSQAPSTGKGERRSLAGEGRDPARRAATFGQTPSRSVPVAGSRWRGEALGAVRLSARSPSENSARTPHGGTTRRTCRSCWRRPRSGKQFTPATFHRSARSALEIPPVPTCRNDVLLSRIAAEIACPEFQTQLTLDGERQREPEST